MNKKADIISIIYVVMFLFIIGIIFLTVSHLNNEIFMEINSSISPQVNHSTPVETMNTLIYSNTNAWDYAFLGIFLGSLIALGLTAYAIRISPVFYWVYGLMSIIVLVLGTILSNAWQDMSDAGELSTTITNFPITDALLGSYYPLIVTVIIILSMVILFGKPPGQQEGFI